MYLGRRNNANGIYKYHCPKCNSIWYRSACDCPGFRDHMLDIAQQLLTKKELIIEMTKQEATQNRIWEDLGTEYEMDNDYEKYSIVHRADIFMTSAFIKATFVRGKNYYKYIDHLYPEKTTSCMYCGNKVYQFTCIDFDFKYYNRANSIEEKKTIIRDICSTLKYESENNSITYRDRQLSIEELKEFMRCVVKTESNIAFLKRRLQALATDYVDSCYELEPQLLCRDLPRAQDLIEDAPPEPVYKQPSVFNRKKVEAENNALKNAYITSSDYIKSIESKKIYEAEKAEFYGKSKSRYEAINQQIREFTLDEYCDCNETLPKMISVLGTELKECHQQLHKSIIDLHKLYSLPYLFEKYQNLPAAATMLEYLESGRCNTLVGTSGAYNLYESELRANTIITKLDQVINSLEQIRSNQYVLYTALNSINDSLEQMNANTQRILSKVDSIEYNSQRIEYNTRQAAYYSRVAADSTATSAFIDWLKL